MMQISDVTPPFVIPVLIATIVVVAFMYRGPAEAPVSYSITITVPTATFEALSRDATGTTTVQSLASKIVEDGMAR